MDRRYLKGFFAVALMIAVCASSALAADESALFSTVAPDALIVLDLSGSMDWVPSGEVQYTNQADCNGNGPFYGVRHGTFTNDCNTGGVAIYSTPSCATTDNLGNPINFYKNISHAGYTTNCSRTEIAKRALFEVLDANGDGIITSSGANSDDAALGIRFGYMRFQNCSTASNESNGTYSTTGGCNYIPANKGLQSANNYSRMFCNRSLSTCDSNASPKYNCPGTSSDYICGATSNGGTHDVAAIREAKTYLDSNLASDPYKKCRDKFVILITDGADTYYCGGNGQEWQGDQYRRRRALVTRIKELTKLNSEGRNYKVFVVGFGAGMPQYLKNTLNWAAFHGGTDNDLVANTGDTTAFVAPETANECDTSARTCYQYNCDSQNRGLTCPIPTQFTCDPNNPLSNQKCYCYANTNDPGEKDLSGYAYIASDADELKASLGRAVSTIQSANYSFSVAAISTARISNENNIYEASFNPVEDESFWLGHLRKYALDSATGEVLPCTVGNGCWDAGETLRSTSAASRKIYTYKNGAITAFTGGSIDPTDLGLAVGDTTGASNVIDFIRGADYNQENWKLGDIFHANPVVISTPSRNFIDFFDQGITGTFETAFDTFRQANERTSANGKRVVVVGANDGQLHFFSTQSGAEEYSFIPPNLLTKLKLISHTHVEDQIGSGGLSHRFFVDGPLTVSNVWLGTENPKVATDWKTVLVVGLGRGADADFSPATPNYLWSANASCTGPFRDDYETGFSHYCGYYGFDVTNTLSPEFKWRLNMGDADKPYFGEPWSKVAIGRIKYQGREKWVGFVGGGGYQYTCGVAQDSDIPRPDPTTRGKGLFAVDLQTGDILASFKPAGMKSIFSPPTMADTDGDGFIDVVYAGDINGNMWRLTLCNATDAIAGCTSPATQWNVSRLFDGSTLVGGQRPIYSGVAVSKDPAGSVWVYWSTGDRQCAMNTKGTDRLFGVRDDMKATTTLGYGNLKDITSSTFSAYDPANKGWFINLSGAGEKGIGDPVLFSGFLFYATYIPTVNPTDPCDRAGNAKLYGLNYITGDGVLSGNTRSSALGKGLPSSLLISLGPTGTPSLYVTVSGGFGTDASTFRFSDSELEEKMKAGMLQPGTIQYWRDMRIQ